MAREKLFVLGVGAQKAGTSWLHQYLSAAPGADFGTLKEYHIWDALTDPALFRDFVVSEADLYAARDAPYELSRLRLRYAMQTVPGAYGGYFAHLLDQSGAYLTGDITPSYSALNVYQLRAIRREMSGFGFKLRVIFILRDPIERTWSGLRMWRRNRVEAGQAVADLPPEMDELEAIFDNTQTMARCRFDLTIQTLEQIFSPDELVYLIYERLFTRDALSKLADALQVPENPTLIDQKVNASPKRLTHIAAPLMTRMFEAYAPIYSFCNQRFPETRALWHSALSGHDHRARAS